MQRFLGVSLALVLAAGPSQAAPVTASVDALIERLGDASFRDRETAARELTRLGTIAFEPLQKAASQHADPEVRQRASSLVEQLRRTTETTRLIQPRPIRLDYQSVPLGTAIADLRNRTGVPLHLDANGVADPTRPVTVSSNDLPPWEAIELFCRSVGLKEQFRDEIAPAITQEEQQLRVVGRRMAYAGPTVNTPESASRIPLILVDGKRDLLPGDRSTAVRILALPPGFVANRLIRGAGQVVIHLDVTPLPNLRWEDIASVRIHRAEDETGRPITVSHRSDVRSPGEQQSDVVVWGGGGAFFVNNTFGTYGEVAGPRANPRIVPVTLRTDDRSIRKLRIFEGAVLGEVSIPNQTILAIDQLPKAVGASATAVGDLKMSILDYRVDDSGKLIMKVRTETPNPWSHIRLGKRATPWLNHQIVWDGGVRPDGNFARLQFHDEAGKLVPHPHPRSSYGNDDGVRQSTEVELVFPRRMDVGHPTRLSLIGNKPSTVEIPFRLQDVMLP